MAETTVATPQPKGFLGKVTFNHPFQLRGPAQVCSIDEAKDGTIVRLAMPGVGEDKYKVWVEKHTLFFEGEGEIEHESENCGRTYGGKIEFEIDGVHDHHQALQVKSEMRNGILWIAIPGLKIIKNKTED